MNNVKKIFIRLIAKIVFHSLFPGVALYYIYREWNYNNLPLIVAIILVWVVTRFASQDIIPALEQAQKDLEHERQLMESAYKMYTENIFTIKKDIQ